MTVWYHGVRGEAPSTAWHLPEKVRSLPAFPLRGKTSARYQNSIVAAKECAERSGRMVRAPAVTEPPVALAGGEKQTAVLADG